MTYADKFPVWVPNDILTNRKETATLLVGTAREYGLTVRHHVASTQGGFFITEDLAEVVFDDTEDEDDADNTTSTEKSEADQAPDTTTPQEGE